MRKSGVITESEEASRAKCASSAPVFMLSIMLWRSCDGVTDTVVPGQTCTSPPLDRRRTAVSGPAVIAEPAPPSFPASAAARPRAPRPRPVAARASGWGRFLTETANRSPYRDFCRDARPGGFPPHPSYRCAVRADPQPGVLPADLVETGRRVSRG